MVVYEKIQVVGFSDQESIISLLYIYHASGFLKDIYTEQTHRVMQLLIFAQLTDFLSYICLITVDCNNMFSLKVVIHPFVYPIKLKMESIVLNQLLALIKLVLRLEAFQHRIRRAQMSMVPRRCRLESMVPSPRS